MQRDLPRILTVHNPDISHIISSVLSLFNFTRGVPYNSTGMSIHFPLLQAAYIQRILERYGNQCIGIDEISKFLEMKLPPEDLEELEAEFFWCLSISFDSLKVCSCCTYITFPDILLKAQGSYSENNRCDQSFILKLLKQV
ncbi:MAG: hypothetical protein NXI00_22950, partial [Cytophagales bacterium]|nr:hypothetical protein [Cytophagales bacterium]